MQEPIALSRNKAQYLWWFWSTAQPSERLRTEATHEAVMSGEFLTFDRKQERLVGTVTHQPMQRLLDTVNSYRDVLSMLRDREPARETLGQAVPNGSGPLVTHLQDSAFLDRSVDPTTVIVGEMSVRGLMQKVSSLPERLELAAESGAKRVLVPSENKRDLADVSDEILNRIQPIFYTDPIQAAIRAMALE
jgi:hypothetical protein